MDVYAVLKNMTTEILDAAEHTLRTAHFAHYESWGDQLTRASLGDLYEHIMISLHHRDLAHIIRHCEGLAAERFNAGFDLIEVGMLSSVLGAGKDAAARTYVQLATHRHAPAIDVNALAEGTV